MDKTNLELFKQALTEAVSNKFDNMAANCTEEIVCSEKHNLAMRAIVYGKTDTKRVWSPRMKRIIAILVAAALLLTSCGIIFCNEIHEVFKELFASITFEGNESNLSTIEEVYELGYIPEGYYFEEEMITPLCIQRKFVNENGDVIRFEQRVLDGTDFTVDSEIGYSKILEVQKYDVYYRENAENNTFIWKTNKYSFIIISNTKLSNDIVVQILEGITKK